MRHLIPLMMACVLALCLVRPTIADPPNIVVVLADDLGYGDVSAYNPNGKIRTPNIDRLARQGLQFTDAHSNGAQCSPTRYGLLTGRYAWRTRLDGGVLPHFDRPLIKNDRRTMADLLKQAGYATAMVGKWHLGLGWQAKSGKTVDHGDWDPEQSQKIDYGKPLTSSPLDYGFDDFFGLNASNNMVPYVFIEDHRVVQKPDGTKSPVFDSESDEGMASPDFDSRQVDQRLWDHAGDWLDKQANQDEDQPFFLYFATSAIHRPCLPVDQFTGTSQAGLRGDKVMELDHIVGRLLEKLNTLDEAENTLIVFTSDNGALPGDPRRALKRYASHEWGKQYHPGKRLNSDSPTYDGRWMTWLTYGHSFNGPYRGLKTSAYEGGHRVPFIVRWPGKIPEGEVIDETICTTDLYATVAEIVDQDLSNDEGEDSFSLLPLFKNQSPDEPLREATVTMSWSGKRAVRRGPWKLIRARNGGGVRAGDPIDAEGQLYHLGRDPGETENLYGERPEKVEELNQILEKYEASGRSAPVDR